MTKILPTLAAPAAPVEGDGLPLPAVLAAAPHRLLFLAGAANVLLAMLWWTAWLVDARWGWPSLPEPAVHAGWLHAIVMQYLVLPPFFFGFLLTVFPRWMNLPALRRAHYVPVGAGLLGGQLLTLAGMLGATALLHAGAVLTIVAWAIGLFWLLRLLWRANDTTWHAVSCAAALALGLTGFILYAVYLHVPDARLMFAAIKIGTFGLLLPVFVTVAHRMFPFFAGTVVMGYKGWRPLGWLAAFWVLDLAHVALELRHAYAALWLPDAALAALTITWVWRNWPRAPMPPLLRVLFLSSLWLPAAMLLYTAQSAWYAASGAFLLGRAPAHALFVGFFGSVLVSMVTRVTYGHSGRPLVLGGVARFGFLAIQGVAVVRIAAELLPDRPAWQAIAAAGWVVAFAPWVIRSMRIYATPRVDGMPG